MLENTETAQYFDRHAPRYDELVSTAGFQLDDAYEYLASYLALTQPAGKPIRVLELGIGTGRFTRHLFRANPAAMVSGIDASGEMLKCAMENLHAYRDRLSLIHGEFPAAIPDADFDCVVSAIALSFYSIDYTELFRKVHRALEPGGLFTYAVNVSHNSSSVDSVLRQMLRKQIAVTDEQRAWLKGIQGKLKLYQVPLDWHRAALSQGGFGDVDCIYLRHKLGIFSGAKPRSAM